MNDNDRRRTRAGQETAIGDRIRTSDGGAIADAHRTRGTAFRRGCLALLLWQLRRSARAPSCQLTHAPAANAIPKTRTFADDVLWGARLMNPWTSADEGAASDAHA